MERRIVKIGVHTTSLIVACTAAIAGVLQSLLMVPMTMVSTYFMQKSMARMLGASDMRMPADFPAPHVPFALLLLAPVLFFIGGYIMTAIFTLLFNFTSPRLGGVPVELADVRM